MIIYRSIKQWKYQLLRTATIQTVWRPQFIIRSSHGWIALTPLGILIVKKGYAWNGPSGPSIDTENFMRGSLFHDPLYQLIEEGLLLNENDKDRLIADQLLRNICLEDGMSKFRAWYVYKSVRIFGAKHAIQIRNRV